VVVGRSAPVWLLALLLAAAAALPGCGDDDSDTEAAPEATNETVPEAIYFEGDACLVTREEATAVLGGPVTRSQGGDYFVHICFWDAEPRTGVSVSVEQFENAEAAAANYAHRRPEDDGEPVAGIGDQAYLSRVEPNPERGARIEVLDGPYIVSVNLAEDVVEDDDLVDLTRSAVDRLPAA
jgi:hypothetical protein